MKTTRTLLSSIVAVLVFALATQASYAQIVPFKSVGTHNEFEPILAMDGSGMGPFSGSGKTSHMGRTTGSGLVSFTAPMPTGNFPNGQLELVSDWVLDEPAEFVARNGDKLCFEGGGQIFLLTADGITFTASWFGEFNVTGGTGRFKHVGPGLEPLDVLAVNDPFELTDEVWTFDYSVVGNIALGRRR